jgi:hypothetical protein
LPEATVLPRQTDPATLVSIAKAARLTGDRDLERAARKLLRDGHGIELSFRASAARLSLNDTGRKGAEDDDE